MVRFYSQYGWAQVYYSARRPGGSALPPWERQHSPQVCSLISGPLPILMRVNAAGDPHMLHTASQHEWTHVAISA